MRSNLSVHYHKDNEEHSPGVLFVREDCSQTHEGEDQPDHGYNNHAEDEIDSAIRNRREGQPTRYTTNAGPADLLNDVQGRDDLCSPPTYGIPSYTDLSKTCWSTENCAPAL